MKPTGKRKRLNRFINKWIRSDLPEEDRSTVLLLGVTRIPTSPVPVRRPCTLSLNQPIGYPLNSFDSSPRVVEESDAVTPTSGSVVCSSRDRRVYELPAVVDGGYDAPGPAMDRSVDSIGTCSLDVDASADLSDWSENSSVGTLRSVSLRSPAVIPASTVPSPAQESKEPRLPSYLSLACTVNGYSTTTNYDPERLAKSRDVSPHRPHEHQSADAITYALQSSLLSPPNLVPLPMQHIPNARTMAEKTITHHHQEFYTKSVSYKESRSYTSTLFSKDSVDCYTNGKTTSKSFQKSYSDATETENKSFIQQRVERLYGPGALAQGFFVTKRQQNRSFEVSSNNKPATTDDHSRSMNDQLLETSSSENTMRQSNSSPALPVLRHLTPEFRAQLPVLSPRRGPTDNNSSMQKSSTVPVLTINGNHSTENGDESKNGVNGLHHHLNDTDSESDVKDGHHFLKVLAAEAERLLILADKAEEELKSDGLSEDAKGIVRSTSGKARLLVSQKMQQFKGLCTNNITQVEGQAFPTTNEDLQGFWDMVMLQVDQVDALFKELDELKANNWIEKKRTQDTVDRPMSNGGATRNRKVPPVVRAQSAAAEEARKKREILRKQMLEERRKAMREHKQQQQQAKQSIEIYVPESS